MGSEDLFKKRKATQNAGLARRNAKYQAKKLVLITCEGEKSEPRYLCSLIKDLGLNKRGEVKEVTVDDRKNGLDPLSLAKRAEKLFKGNRDEGIVYDRVYCVFDKDSHDKYDEALRFIKIKKLAKNVEFIAINSVPCFEFWLLLHFEKTTASFQGTETQSPCGQVIAKLKKYPEFIEYGKGKTDTYYLTKAYLDTAINSAKQICQDIPTNGDNPSSNIYELVEHLLSLIDPIV